MNQESSPLLPSNDLLPFQSYFYNYESKSIIFLLFSPDKSGKSFRSIIKNIFGVFSFVFAFLMLKHLCYYSNSRSFFVVSMSISTIGYGPIVDPENNLDHKFLSLFYGLFVLPYIILQVIVSGDETETLAASIHHRVQLRRKLSRLSAETCFSREVRLVLGEALLLVLLLLVLGTLCYRYIAEQDTWVDGIFYSLTSATSIGYGTFDLENDWGFFAVGMYALSCHYIMPLVYVRFAGCWIAASQNIQETTSRDQVEKSNRNAPHGDYGNFPSKNLGELRRLETVDDFGQGKSSIGGGANRVGVVGRRDSRGGISPSQTPTRNISRISHQQLENSNSRSIPAPLDPTSHPSDLNHSNAFDLNFVRQDDVEQPKENNRYLFGNEHPETPLASHQLRGKDDTEKCFYSSNNDKFLSKDEISLTQTPLSPQILSLEHSPKISSSSVKNSVNETKSVSGQSHILDDEYVGKSVGAGRVSNEPTITHPGTSPISNKNQKVPSNILSSTSSSSSSSSPPPPPFPSASPLTSSSLFFQNEDRAYVEEEKPPEEPLKKKRHPSTSIPLPGLANMSEFKGRKLT